MDHSLTAQPPRFDITPHQIDQVVTKFYAKVRADSVLGPVFAAHVPEDGWPAHEAKIASFWRNAILYERSYDGNPMQKHMAARDVHGEHFPHWLALFDTVLAAELQPQTALAFSTLAHRIARGLRMGVEDLRAPVGAPPSL
ncbi:hemoglobin [Litoreibacter ascidiaceicola]|uniref:Hemoglobin n=1 Tax=Litoreibacter ascidiaceicola TaxID=1486859 RepID=A0A1M4XY81_9RHOB|nr:group III truncated hemoglobin [Litoreibacter ascidiaceicola]SHE98273.1 hemoglobin [Litoreibacter ascidiaceicola]